MWHLKNAKYNFLLLFYQLRQQTIYSVCHVCIFCYQVDGKDQNKKDFLKSGMNLGVKSIQRPNRESIQNVSTKSAFLPKTLLVQLIRIHLVKPLKNNMHSDLLWLRCLLLGLRELPRPFKYYSHIRAVWQSILINNFQCLNNITRISTYFFIHIYF